MPGSRNRDDFIAAAKSLFASRGFDGVTMRNIADALGLTQAALYYHFTSKDELYLAVLERTASRPADGTLPGALRGSGPRPPPSPVADR